MIKEIQDFHRTDDRNTFNSYQDRQREKSNNNYIIKEDFKKSITRWQCKKKIDKLRRSLQNENE